MINKDYGDAVPDNIVISASDDIKDTQYTEIKLDQVKKGTNQRCIAKVLIVVLEDINTKKQMTLPVLGCLEPYRNRKFITKMLYEAGEAFLRRFP